MRRYASADYDVALGMLERRLDSNSKAGSSVRRTVAALLRNATTPAPIHRALMRLSDQAGTLRVVTTNFDRLLEAAAEPAQQPVLERSLAAIPRPSRGPDFAGVFHIHGALDPDPDHPSEVILTDRDFGEFYLRRRVVPDFIYDAARLFHLVLVGYSADDPPMRYLLNAVAADGTRFDDLRERFTFVGAATEDPVSIEDWRGRGITPIHYDSANGHAALGRLLERWAALSAGPTREREVERTLIRLTRQPYATASQSERDFVGHLFRREGTNERRQLLRRLSGSRAHIDWLDTLLAEIVRETPVR
mgnify:CR=1 FL=1